MADGDEENESTVFEITDFTTASEWESFISRIEEIIQKWKLDNSNKKPSFIQRVRKFSSSSSKQTKQSNLKPIPKKCSEPKEQCWETKSDSLHFSDFCFDITYHYMSSKEEKTNEAHHGFEDGLPPAVLDMFDMDYDFPPRVHCLSRWYGLKEFLVLSPAVENAGITSESRCHLLLSSVSVALANTKCFVPLLVQLHHKWRRLYLGICLGSGFRTTFEMAHLRHIPKQLNHLKGLLDVFKDKLVLRGASSPPVTITVRFTYFLNEWSDSVWPQAPPDIDSCLGDEIGLSDLSTLPFGTVQDAVSELHLSVTWPCLSEDVIVDNGIYSDLDPLQAPQWHVRVRMAEDPRCLLGEYLDHYIKLCHRKESTSKLLRNDAFFDEGEDSAKDFSTAFRKLTKPIPVLSTNLSTAVTRATTKITGVGTDESPVPPELLKAILKYLFPDAELDSDAIAARQEEMLNSKEKPTTDHSNDRFRSLKGSPKDSLTYALAICLCIVNHSYGGLRAVAHIWEEFILEIRYRWDRGFLIPRLELQSPNLDCCLIHQKLQMLNYCIARKCQSRKSNEIRLNKEGSENGKNSQSSTRNPDRPLSARSNPSQGDDSSDDEFFEALEEPDDSDEDSSSEVVVSDAVADGSRASSCSDGASRIREGALRRCGDLRLLVSGEPLYIPVTQEPAPMTEDSLQEHAEVLTQLGTTEEGARIRAQMQSASLLSDMEAFKAANPGCLLEDFVRWYSPNDWLQGEETEEEIEYRRKQELERLKDHEDETGDEDQQQSGTGDWELEDEEITEGELSEAEKVNIDSRSDVEISEETGDESNDESQKAWCEQGRLSLRMRVRGNIWEEVWQNARPRPVRRQKRLFDETREAEKVFHYLAGLRPAEVATGLLSVLLQSCLRRIEQAGGGNVVHVSGIMDRIIRRASGMFESVQEQLTVYKDLFRDIRSVELTIARAQSLSFKLFSSDANDHQANADINREAFIASLLEKPEVNVVGASRGPMGHVIRNLFAKQQMIRTQEEDYDNHEVKKPSHRHSDPFPRPAGREFILRTTVNRPGKNSRQCPQRMYCVLAGDEFRLAAAFTSDTTFT